MSALRPWVRGTGVLLAVSGFAGLLYFGPDAVKRDNPSGIVFLDVLAAAGKGVARQMTVFSFIAVLAGALLYWFFRPLRTQESPPGG